MKNSIKYIGSFLLFLFFSTSVAAQCNNSGNQYPSSTITPTLNAWKTIASNNYAGEYAVVSVVSGRTYYFSTCSGDGASCSYDSELTLRNSSGSYLAYNDDAGGTSQSSLTWTATYTGTVEIHLNEIYLSDDRII